MAPLTWPFRGRKLNEELFQSIRIGDMDAVKRALESGADANARGKREYGDGTETALYAAVFADNAEIVGLLLERGADPNQGEVLHTAAQLYSLEIINQLLDAGADVNLKSESEASTPLHSAAYGFRPDVVELLVNRGADVEARDGNGKTPLLAVGASASVALDDRKKRKIPTYRKLLDLGADVSAFDETGFGPLHNEAGYFGLVKDIELLIKAGADVKANGDAGTPLHAAVTRYAVAVEMGDNEAEVHALAIAKHLLKAGTDPSERAPNGVTPQEYAESEDCGEMADLLSAARGSIEVAAQRQHEKGGGMEVRDSVMNAGANVLWCKQEGHIRFIRRLGRIIGIWVKDFPGNTSQEEFLCMFCASENKDKAYSKIQSGSYSVRASTKSEGYDVHFE